MIVLCESKVPFNPATGCTCSVNRATLTARYLDEVTKSGAVASELLGQLPESEMLNVYYHGRYLSRPLFLGHRECEQLYADLVNLRSALVSLPNRLYGGDLAAFARAVGANELQVSAVMRTRGAAVTMQTRADMYADQSGFRLLELNMGSALGGMDNADMSRALLEYGIAGITTNIPYHLAIVDDQDFRAGRLSTHFIPEHPQLVERAAEWAERKRHFDRVLRDGAHVAAVAAAVAVTL